MKRLQRSALLALLALFACQQASRTSNGGERLLLSALSSCDAEQISRAVDKLGVEGLNAFIEGEASELGPRTPLWWAVTRGCDEGVEILLSAGADPNQPTYSDPGSGVTPLSWAAMQARPSAVRSLLKFGADPDARDRRHATALFHAARSGDVETVQLLLAAGLDANDRDHSGATPLHAGARYAEVARILMEQGADVNARTNPPRGTTPIFRVRSAGSDQPVDLDAALGILLDAGVSVDQSSTHGDTPLVAASRGGDLPAVRALLRAGADPSLRGYGDQTALAAARAAHRRTKESLREGWLRTLLWATWPRFRRSGERELRNYSEIEALLEEHGGQE